MNAPRDVSHDDAVVSILKADPDFADEYLAAALGEAGLPGGHYALLAALRHIAEAQGMATVAERAGMPRESLYRALSNKGNPTVKTLLAVLGAAGLRLSVNRPSKPRKRSKRMAAPEAMA